VKLRKLCSYNICVGQRVWYDDIFHIFCYCEFLMLCSPETEHFMHCLVVCLSVLIFFYGDYFV